MQSASCIQLLYQTSEALPPNSVCSEWIRWLTSWLLDKCTVFKGLQPQEKKPLFSFLPLVSLGALESERWREKQKGLVLSRLMSPIAPLILPLWCCVSTLTMTLSCLLLGGEWPVLELPGCFGHYEVLLLSRRGDPTKEDMSDRRDLSVAHHFKWTGQRSAAGASAQHYTRRGPSFLLVTFWSAYCFFLFHYILFTHIASQCYHFI